MEKKSIVEVFKELRESGLGETWDKIICVCRGLMKDNPCECNCKEFHDESLSNVQNVQGCDTTGDDQGTKAG